MGALGVSAAVTGCTSAGSDNTGGGRHRRAEDSVEPAPAPDPKALDEAKNRPDAALLEVTWSGERTFSIIYDIGDGRAQSTREQPHKEGDRWYGRFALPITVEPGTPKVVSVGGAPIGISKGIAHASVYHNGSVYPPPMGNSVASGSVSTGPVTIG